MTFTLVKAEDKKHSVVFKPATDEDRKYCSAFYLARPYSTDVTEIEVNITVKEVN